MQTASRFPEDRRRGCGRSFAVAALAAFGCGGAPAEDPAPDGAGPDPEPRPTPALVEAHQLCKLLNDRNVADPTPNAVQFRANVLGADLGIPVEVAGQLYIFFGDTIGFAGIWGGGQSHPDSVGFAMDSAASVAAQPALLCNRLGIVTLPPDASIGPDVDGRVQADFAAGAMIPPPGRDLGEFIHNPSGAGNQRFGNLPGDFEVPSGAFAHDGSIYVFYTTVVSPSDITMVGSYLARWDAPATTGVPAYQILYEIDERADGSGGLGGDFINISAAVAGDYVYLFGTGVYRASPIHLARKSLATLATPGGFERFDAATRTWREGRGEPIIAAAGYGETSTLYHPGIDRWMFLAEEQGGGMNRIVARFADLPEGPWSDAIVVHDMADAGFRAEHCCGPDGCVGTQFMDCARTGFYGSYQLPAARADGDRFTIAYTLSSFDPYNVALFEATFR